MNSYPKRCTKCGKRFKPGDRFYYDILDDAALDDRCKQCAEHISMMAYGIIPKTKKKAAK